MSLSDISIRRPIICLVASILIVIVGVLRFGLLPVREYPNVESPTISIGCSYPGASAEVVETKITEPLEKEIASVEGIKIIRSSSSEQSSSISVEFDLDRNIDEAANDIRDRASRVRLPNDAREVRVNKTDPESSPVFTISFNSEKHSRLQIAELLERLVQQRIQSIPGVASTKIDGPRFAMRLWIDNDRLAAYGLTVADVERSLRAQNVDVPSGRIESVAREFPVRFMGKLDEAVEFENLVLATRGNSQVMFKDIGRVELGRDDYRSETWFNGNLSVGFQVVRQPQADLIAMTNGIKALLPQIRADMPSDINIVVSKDDAVYVERCVQELYKTFFEAAILVMLTIFLFLRDWRATIIPLFSIPVSIVGSIAVIASLGFSINVLTLLAFVLSIGLVVDDAIVMLENIYRRIEEGEPVIQAAIFGARQVTFAIIATTLTLVAVFTPVAFQSGQTGRLFYEFGISLAVSVLVSAFVALTLTPMMCSRLLKGHGEHGGERGWFYRKTEGFFKKLNRAYTAALERAMAWRWAVLLTMVVFCGAGVYCFSKLQRELVPSEDRGIISANAIPPVGVTPEYLQMYILDMAKIIGEIPEMDRYFVRTTEGSSAYVTGTLRLWEDRTRTTQDVITELRRKFATAITGVQATVASAKAFGSNASGAGRSNAVQLILQGTEYSELQSSGDTLLKSMRESGLFGPSRIDPSFTKPQLQVTIDRAKAADLHVAVSDIASTLETMFGSRQVTEFQRGNQQYYVILQVEREKRVTPSALSGVYVRSTTGHLVQLTNLVTIAENSVPQGYPHYNRLRSMTVSAQLAEGVTIGDAVTYLDREAHATLPAGYSMAWGGEARSYVESETDTSMLFVLALIFTFLILAAQFESWIHPMTIFAGVALALSGGVLVLYCSRFWGQAMTDNLFSRFGLIMLIGMVANNGILIVEFANQLQVKEGLDGPAAARKSAALRFRPILMTSFATILGASPIAFAGGAGAETRNPLGLVVVGGLGISTFLTLFVVPIVYVLMDRLCVKLTGHSSAAGLKLAAKIKQDSEEAEKGRIGEPAMAK